MSDYQINIIYAGKDDGATDLAEQLADGLKQVQDQGEKTKETGDGLFSKFTVTAGDAVHAVQAVAGAVRDIGSALIGGNAQFEQYNVAYTTLIKNSDDFKAANASVTDSLQLNAAASQAAKQHMQDLADFGARTPFELPGVVEADTVLQGFGLNSQAAAEKFGFAGKEILTIAGDVASGTGADFKEMALTLGKFSSGATGEAISRMQELGITNRDELAKLGLEFSKAGQLMSPLPEAMNVVLTLMKQKYGGLMDAQSQTFTGMMSNLEDWKGATLRSLGEPIFEAVKPQLAGLLTFLGSDTTKQAIASFAQGMADGVQVIGEIGAVIHDYGVPALEGLTAATVAYAIVTLPAAIPGIVAATTAFAAQAVAVAAAVAPLAAVAVAVAAVSKAYADFREKNESATQSLLESRAWWNNSTQALHDFDAASDATKTQLGGLKTAVEENRAELEREITSLAMRKEAGLITDAQFQQEMATINQHRVAVTASSEALAEQVRIAGETEKYDAHEEALHQMVSAQDDLTQAVQLTEQELKEYEKAVDKVYKEGPAALGKAVDTENQFLAKSAEQQQAHEQKIADLQSQFADAKTAKAKAAVQEKIDAENAGYQQSATDAAVAYAQQEAAQRAHLGQELIDYIQAQATKNASFREKADALTAAIAQQYGITENLTTQSFGKMLNDIDAWAANGGQSADQLAQHLSTTTDTAAATQRQMDALARKYTIELEEDLAAHKITADEYAAALRDIPKRVTTEIITTHVEKYETGGTKTGDPSGGTGKRAGGGPVDAMAPYIVGEEGPELFVPGVSGTIVSASVLASARSDWAGVGSSMIGGMVSGVVSGSKSLASAAVAAAGTAIDATKNALGIGSPSRVAYEEIGLPIIQGATKGVKDNQGVFSEAMKGVFGAGGVLGSMSNAAAAEAKRIGLSSDYIEHQTEAIKAEEQQLSYLQQQAKLVDLIKDNGLDAKAILGDIKLGLNADPAAILEAMKNALGGVVQKAGEQFNVPAFASGVRGFGGGLALVGERGPELLRLPRGSSVYPNDQTQSMLAGGAPITVNVYGVQGQNVEQLAEAVIRKLGDRVNLRRT